MKYNLLVKTMFLLLLALSKSNMYCMEQQIVDSLSVLGLKNQVKSILAEPVQSDWSSWAKNFFMRRNDARAHAIIELASNTGNDDDVRKLLILAGQYKSFGDFDISLWLPGGGLLIDAHEINVWEDPVGLVVKNNQFKELAKILTDEKKKILQAHLVLAILLKKESMAELFVLLGADIDTPIDIGICKSSVENYARSQEMLGLADLIEQRMLPAVEEGPIAACLRLIVGESL